MMLLKVSYLPPRFNCKHERGFSLIEMAIVMVILGALIGGLLMPLSTQRDVSNRKAVETQLDEIRNALMGYVLLNGRFPCPSEPNPPVVANTGREARNITVTPAVCTFPNGFVPYIDLGIQGTLINGLLVDTWQMPVRYRLTNVSNWMYANAINLNNLSDPPPPPPAPTTVPNFQVCRDDACAAVDLMAQNVVAVIFSTGKDGPEIPVSASPDQVLNLSGGTNFVMRTPTEHVATGMEFDDILVWIARPQLIYELSKAGRL